MISEYQVNDDGVEELVYRPATAEEVAAFDEREAASAEFRALLENADTIRGELRAGLDQIDAQIATLSNAPTAAQVRDAVLFNLRATKRLARLILSEIDATD